MSLYDKHTTYVILIVVGLMHILSIVFMCVFTVKFLINDHAPAAYLLLAILIIPLLVVDYFGFIKTNAFAKFLLRWLAIMGYFMEFHMYLRYSRIQI